MRRNKCENQNSNKFCRETDKQRHLKVAFPLYCRAAKIQLVDLAINYLVNSPITFECLCICSFVRLILFTVVVLILAGYMSCSCKIRNAAKSPSGRYKKRRERSQVHTQRCPLQIGAIVTAGFIGAEIPNLTP